MSALFSIDGKTCHHRLYTERDDQWNQKGMFIGTGASGHHIECKCKDMLTEKRIEII